MADVFTHIQSKKNQKYVTSMWSKKKVEGANANPTLRMIESMIKIPVMMIMVMIKMNKHGIPKILQAMAYDGDI